jgi:hypothetical protein
MESLRERGFLIFGFGTIALSFIPSGITPSTKNLHTAGMMSSFRAPRFHWKKQAGSPSGLGAFACPI